MALVLGRMLLLSSAPCDASEENSPSRELVTIEWRAPAPQIARIKTALQFDGTITGDPATAEPKKGLPLVYVMAGAVLLPYLADALIETYRDVKYGATVVVATKEGLSIQHDPGLASGTLIIRDDKGVRLEATKDATPDVKQLIDLLFSLVSSEIAKTR